MVDWLLSSIVFLAIVGLITILLMPREKNKRQKPMEDVFKDLDDYALLYTLLSQRKYKAVLKKARQIRKKSSSVDRKIVLKKFESMVKKHA